MDKTKIYLTAMLCMVAVFVGAERERSIRFQNSLRFGYDDNVYQDDVEEQDTTYIVDTVTLSGKLTFSSRTDMQVYWQPEFVHRFDADPDFVFYQSLYAGLNHAVSQRLFVRINETLRWQEKEGKADVTTDQRLFRNTLSASANYTVNPVSEIRLNGAYSFNIWEEDLIGGNVPTVNNPEGLNNDYEQYSVGAVYDRELKRNVTHGLVGVDYTDHTYEGNRGGYDSILVYAGATHNFSPHVSGNANLGYSVGNVDNSIDDTSIPAPYARAGLAYNPTARTQFTTSAGYSFQYADNSFWNVSEEIDATIGIRHDLSAKVSVSSSLTYYMSFYKSDYLSRNGDAQGLQGDADDQFVRFTLRGSYQLNRNNFLDAGYEYSTRVTDTSLLREFDRNRFDIGWRIRL